MKRRMMESKYLDSERGKALQELIGHLSLRENGETLRDNLLESCERGCHGGQRLLQRKEEEEEKKEEVKEKEVVEEEEEEGRVHSQRS